MKLRSLILPLIALSLNSCIVVDENGNFVPEDGGRPTQLPGSTPGPSYGQPLTAVTGQGDVTIREGNRTLCSFRTAGPFVEQTRWFAEQEQIVVKSRGGHGPATVQLFDSRTGRELGRVMAYEIRNGQPIWGAGMAE